MNLNSKAVLSILCIDVEKAATFVIRKQLNPTYAFFSCVTLGKLLSIPIYIMKNTYQFIEPQL